MFSWFPVETSTEELDQEIARLEAGSGRYSLARLLIFLLLVTALFLLPVSVPGGLGLAAAALVAFVFALRGHMRLLERKTLLERRRLLAREERQRRSSRRSHRHPPELPESPLPLERGLRLHAPEADSFELDPGVIEDLEVLAGPRTLFGFLDISSTTFGARRLRHLLTHPLRSTADIRSRQGFVRELAGDGGVRRSLLECLVSLRDYSFEPVPRFLRSPATFAGRRSLLVVANVLGTAVPILWGLVVVEPLLLSLAILLSVLNMVVIGRHVRSSNPARDRLLLLGPLVRGLLALEEALDGAALESSEGARIVDALRTLRPAARRLRRSIALLEYHSYGVIFEILNILTLWELRILPLAESVLRRHRELLERGAGALGDLEAYLSLACPLAEQETFCLPEPVESDRPRIESVELGHPLIEADRVVKNRVDLGDGAGVWILTGSNMTGKSTFLKAVGTNTVLAGAGGPVCARSFRWTPLAIHCDINIRDSLDDGKSYFQVEVERVLQVIRAAEASPMILGIFDELFRGTNSTERLAISRAILRRLRSSGILLLVATHDMALTRLVTEEREPGMANYHLRERLDGRTMSFDYRIHEGPATTRNAIRVLEVSDYPGDITDAARRELP